MVGKHLLRSLDRCYFERLDGAHNHSKGSVTWYLSFHPFYSLYEKPKGTENNNTYLMGAVPLMTL